MKIDPITSYILKEEGIIDKVTNKMSDFGIGERPKNINFITSKNKVENAIHDVWTLLPRDAQNLILDKTVSDENAPVLFKLLKWAITHNMVNVDKTNITLTSQGILSGAIGATVLISFIIWAGNKIGKIFSSKGEKMCSKYQGTEKEKCLNTYKAKGLIEANKSLVKMIRTCKHSKNVGKCKQEIESKIKANQEKIRSLIKRK
jgi:hypothetical protein